MDWKRIKTIFILTFFLLDIFLLVQLKGEITENKYKPMVSESDEEILKNIKYNVKIPKYDEKFTLISAKNIGFSNELGLDKKKNITVEQTVGSSIHVKINEPFPVNLETENEEEIRIQLATFLQEFCPNGTEYRLWSISEDKQTIILNQYYNNKPIFFDYSKINIIPNGIIELELNKAGEIIGFNQTYLLISKQGNAQKIIPAEDALIKLFNFGYIQQDSVVEDIDLGYFSLISIENIQVFAPTWLIQISGKSYMVNAIDGTVTEYTETE